jgi:hypothetical protein
MTVQEEILQHYQNSHSALVSQLNEIDKNRKIYPLWTIREIVAHLSGWDDAAVGLLNALLKGETPPTPAMRGVDVYNAETVSTREGLSYDHIVREYYSTRERLLSLIRQANDKLLTAQVTLPWGGEGTAEGVTKFLSGHEAEHAEDIKKFIEEANRK